MFTHNLSKRHFRCSAMEQVMEGMENSGTEQKVRAIDLLIHHIVGQLAVLPLDEKEDCTARILRAVCCIHEENRSLRQSLLGHDNANNGQGQVKAEIDVNIEEGILIQLDETKIEEESTEKQQEEGDKQTPPAGKAKKEQQQALGDLCFSTSTDPPAATTPIASRLPTNMFSFDSSISGPSNPFEQSGPLNYTTNDCSLFGAGSAEIVREDDAHLRRITEADNETSALDLSRIPLSETLELQSKENELEKSVNISQHAIRDFNSDSAIVEDQGRVIFTAQTEQVPEVEMDQPINVIPVAEKPQLGSIFRVDDSIGARVQNRRRVTQIPVRLNPNAGTSSAAADASRQEVEAAKSAVEQFDEQLIEEFAAVVNLSSDGKKKNDADAVSKKLPARRIQQARSGEGSHAQNPLNGRWYTKCADCPRRWEEKHFGAVQHQYDSEMREESGEEGTREQSALLESDEDMENRENEEPMGVVERLPRGRGKGNLRKENLRSKAYNLRNHAPGQMEEESSECGNDTEVEITREEEPQPPEEDQTWNEEHPICQQLGPSGERCGKQCEGLNGLFIHSRLKHGGVPCSHCGERFTGQKKFDEHLKKKHGITTGCTKGGNGKKNGRSSPVGPLVDPQRISLFPRKGKMRGLLGLRRMFK